MKTSWDPIPDKWNIGLEAYYLTARGARLGWVTRYPKLRSSLGALWSAGSFHDDRQTRWLGDFETKDAAMQAVLTALGLATGEPPQNPHKHDMSASNDAALEAMVNAALAGHDLIPFEPLHSGGYQARCRRCRKTVWINDKGLLYTLLEDHCGPSQP